MKPTPDSSIATRTLLPIVLIIAISCSSQNERNGARDPATDGSRSDTLANELGTYVTFSPEAVVGANVYVPVYSHIYQLNQRKTFNLTATLSIRNTDLRYPLKISKVHYFDSKGELVHKYLEQSQSVSPLSSISFVVEEEDLRGGVGANFLVLWESEHEISRPVIEAVMISTSQQQGISFVSEGRTLHNLDRTSQ